METPPTPPKNFSRFTDRSFNERLQSKNSDKKRPTTAWRGHRVRKNATGDMTREQMQLRSALFGKENVETSNSREPLRAPTEAFLNTPETRALLGQIITQLSPNGAEGLPKREYVVTGVKV